MSNVINKSALEERLDLFDNWVVQDWFSETQGALSAMKPKTQKKLFRLWLELFMALYEDLTDKVATPKKRDQIFNYFVNDVFATALDNYKWFESEKQQRDIGLLEALENVSMEEWYIELLSKYSQVY